MPGVGMKCLNTIQPIFGVDMHRAIPPPLPTPPFAPHVVVWGEGWSQKMSFQWAIANSKAASRESGCAKPVAVCYGYGIGRAHDAGPHPGHIWPNLLLPLILLGSGSKSQFASGTVKLPTGNMAIAVLFAVNLNLDCQDFPIPPLPTGTVIAALCTVKAGFTLGDLLGGLFSMLVDMAISWISGLIVAGLTSAIAAVGRGLLGGALARLFGGAFSGAFGRGFARGFVQNFKSAFGVAFVSRLTPRALAAAFAKAAATPVTRELLGKAPYLMGPVGTALGIGVVGSPVGYSNPSAGYGRAAPALGQPDPNAWANQLGHRAVGENPESSSAYAPPANP
jgi:hypothetical protein